MQLIKIMKKLIEFANTGRAASYLVEVLFFMEQKARRGRISLRKKEEEGGGCEKEQVRGVV